LPTHVLLQLRLHMTGKAQQMAEQLLFEVVIDVFVKLRIVGAGWRSLTKTQLQGLVVLAKLHGCCVMLANCEAYLGVLGL
jgi:hypothetical protein